MINIEVYSTHAVIRSQQPLTVGLRGASAHFAFGEPWAELTKTAVFRQGEKTVTVVDIGKQVEIPWEVLTLPGVPVMIGIYGTDAEEKLVIPTVWAETEPVRPGTDPDQGVSPAEPTPSVWEQLQGHMGSLEQLQTNDKTSLAAAINEANRAVCLVKVSKEEDGTYSIDTNIPALLNAYSDGKTLICDFSGALMHLTSYSSAGLFEFTSSKNNTKLCVTILPDGTVTYTNTVLATNQSKLPNPKKLTFIGNATAEYDGSEEMIVGIPTKLSQLQNDSGFMTEVPAPVYLVTINDANKAVESYAERLAAYQSGYVVQCDYLGVRLPLKAVVDTDFMFSGTIDGTSYHVVVRSNGSTVISKRSLASEKDIPTKLSELTNDSGFLTEAPVTSVNGQTGAVTVDIPTKVSQLQNDSGFLTEVPVTTMKVSLTEQPDGSYLSDLSAADIMAAYKANKTVHCYHDKMILPLIYSVITGAVFSGIYDGQIHTVTVNSNKVATVTATPVSSGGGADGLLFDQATGTLYLLQSGQILGNGVQLPAAEGGPTNNAVLTLENTTGWSAKTIPQEQGNCMLSINWSSVDGGVSTGTGTLAVNVENELRYSTNIKQGEYTLNVMDYLLLGENRVDLTITDFRGNSKSILFTVSVYDPDALISTKLVERTLTGDYTNDRVAKVGFNAFNGLVFGRLALPNATGDIMTAFAGLTADEVELNSVTSTSYWMVNGSTIGVLRLPNVTTIATNEDFRAIKVERVVFDRLEVWNKNLNGFFLQVVTFDFHNLKSLPNLPSGMLSNLIIRTPDVCTLGSAPESTTAKLFVPEDLLADYKSNTNWGVMADRIFAIEDITVDGTVTGEPDSKKMEDIGNV